MFGSGLERPKLQLSCLFPITSIERVVSENHQVNRITITAVEFLRALLEHGQTGKSETMPHECAYRPDLLVIETKYHGIITADEFVELAAEVGKLVTEHNCFLTLGDFRDATLLLTTMEIYELPERLSKKISSMGLSISKLKRAFVISNELKDYFFFETVAANRGQFTKVFQNVGEALAWLREK